MVGRCVVDDLCCDGCCVVVVFEWFVGEGCMIELLKLLLLGVVVL